MEITNIKLKPISKITMIEALEYECHSHWLASWISFSWGQELIASYIAWKVRRKYRRYSFSVEQREMIINKINQQ